MRTLIDMCVYLCYSRSFAFRVSLENPTLKNVPPCQSYPAHNLLCQLIKQYLFPVQVANKEVHIRKRVCCSFWKSNVYYEFAEPCRTSNTLKFAFHNDMCCCVRKFFAIRKCCESQCIYRSIYFTQVHGSK